jgi:hypothetical protein
MVGQAALKVVSSKVGKQRKHVLITICFHTFTFDTFSFLASEAASLLQRVQKVMNSNVVSPRAKNVIFTRISFAIQKGLAALARLPLIHM